MDDKNNGLKDQIHHGSPQDDPAGKPLQEAYWILWEQQRYLREQWTALLGEYVRNPIYATKSKATDKDRVQRLTTALTGGNSRNIKVDLTWRRFIEGLVVMKVDVLTVTMKAEKGNYGETKTVKTSARPKQDILKTLNGEDREKPRLSATEELNLLFSNPRGTAGQMEHILGRLLWLFFAEFRIDSEFWARLSTNYVNNPANCPAIASRRNDMRHNMQQNMRMRKKLSWKRFLMVLKAIDVRKLECSFTITKENSNFVYESTIYIDLTKLNFWRP